MYIFAGGGGGGLSDIQVTSCPDKNAGAQDVRLYQYVIYITVRNRNITPVYKRIEITFIVILCDIAG